MLGRAICAVAGTERGAGRLRRRAGAAPAHDGRSAQDAEAPTIKVQANEVNLIFTVTDKKGHFITGLNQSSFGLLDNR